MWIGIFCNRQINFFILFEIFGLKTCIIHC